MSLPADLPTVSSVTNPKQLPLPSRQPVTTKSFRPDIDQSSTSGIEDPTEVETDADADAWASAVKMSVMAPVAPTDKDSSPMISVNEEGKEELLRRMNDMAVTLRGLERVL